ncbi:protein FAM122B isoform X2 [Gouania willdenowi]|uniref:protein FAM122B isoform X2 n=1 Tax=Gouania willdenowi TaxID=441366 RepID=UPI001056442B|nr:protein FAM122B-like isoform X2 [Gouania willdenowi]
MERMEIDQCAGAGVLRRSNSAPMITSVSDRMDIFSPVCSSRYRRSSVSVNPSTPSQVSSRSFCSTTDRIHHRKLEEEMETLRGSEQRLSVPSVIPVDPVIQWNQRTWSQDGGVTPNSSPRRRSRPSVAVTPLKRKGGAESDGPPKKLFVAGVTEPERE